MPPIVNNQTFYDELDMPYRNTIYYSPSLYYSREEISYWTPVTIICRASSSEEVPILQTTDDIISYSPVLTKLATYPWAKFYFDRNSGRVTPAIYLPDIQVRIMKLVLSFSETGDIRVGSVNFPARMECPRLFQAADFLILPGLKKLCAEIWLETYPDADSWTSLVGCISRCCAKWEIEEPGGVFEAIIHRIRNRLPWWLMKDTVLWAKVQAKDPEWAHDILVLAGWLAPDGWGVKTADDECAQEKGDWWWMFEDMDLGEYPDAACKDENNPPTQ